MRPWMLAGLLAVLAGMAYSNPINAQSAVWESPKAYDVDGWDARPGAWWALCTERGDCAEAKKIVSTRRQHRAVARPATQRVAAPAIPRGFVPHHGRSQRVMAETARSQVLAARLLPKEGLEVYGVNTHTSYYVCARGATIYVVEAETEERVHLGFWSMRDIFEAVLAQKVLERRGVIPPASQGDCPVA